MKRDDKTATKSTEYQQIIAAYIQVFNNDIEVHHHHQGEQERASFVPSK